jgi:hypothetical protein
MYVVNKCTVTPVRQEPSEGSEQLTQLLFGEVCEVLDHLPRWTKVRSQVDGQEGWVDFKMVVPDEIGENWVLPTTVVTTPIALATSLDNGEEILLTLGTRLPNYTHGIFEILGKQYLIDPSAVDYSQLTIEDVAQSLLNAPYLWGGKNILGLDCSGFTQVVYSVFGVNLLRNAREQMTQGTLVDSLADVQPGDLAFFDHADRDPKATNISHVGILLDHQTIIHCSGNVHIDMIDEQGIHLEDGELTHHLVQIRRYF